MCHRRCWSLLPALALVFALVACDSDSTGPDGPLNEQQLQSMMEALAASGGFIMPFFFVGGEFATEALVRERPRLASSEHEVTYEVDESLPCPISGTVHLEGQWTEEESESGWQDSFTVTQTHLNCESMSMSDETVWTFNGAPNLSLSGQLTETFSEFGDHFEMEISQSGGIAWEGVGHSGTCNINLDFHVEETEMATGGFSGSFSVQGSACGHSISISETFDEV